MRVAVVGSGAVGGYFGARLARAGHDVVFVARGAHLAAMRARGLEVRSAVLGDFSIRCEVAEHTADLGPVDLVLFAVKLYDNETALPLLRPLVGAETAVLTLQNGVDSADHLASHIGAEHVLAGATYVATAVDAPGRIVQTGTHRSIIFGEAFGARTGISARVRSVATAMAPADIQVTAVADARVPIWDKFVYLAPFSGITGAARLPIGPLWAMPHVRELFFAAAREVADIAAAEGVSISADRFETLRAYMDGIPPTTRSSLLVDLQRGKPIEVEALQGAAVRRAAALGIPVPILSTLYATLKPWERPRAIPG